MIKKAINHKGYALVEILQPCVVFNKVNTYKWYKDRIYKLDENYDPKNRSEAFKKAEEFGDKGIPIGLLYLQDNKPTYHESHPVLMSGINPLDRHFEPTMAEKLVDEFL